MNFHIEKGQLDKNMSNKLKISFLNCYYDIFALKIEFNYFLCVRKNCV